MGAAGDAIFLLRDGALTELAATPYDSEALLQRLLAEHPSLLAGGQIDRVMPRRWLLVAREMGVADEPDGARRWSVDHLFLDQAGIPTLVEVKRSTDSRIRREVVGQLLDYAANAIVHWPVEAISARFLARCEQDGVSSEAELARLLGAETDAATFWDQVRTNLQAGRIRLIFVADVIPAELRRIVEFLNAQMDPAEVLALEIKQYAGEGLQTLVPRVLGQTAQAQQRKGQATARETRSWDEASFFGSLEGQAGPVAARIGRTLHDWAAGKGRIWFGSGRISGSFGLTIEGEFGERYLMAIFTYGTLEIYFQWLKSAPPFDDEGLRREFLARLNAVDGISLPADAISRRPSVKLVLLAADDRLQRLIDALDWAVAKIQRSLAQPPGTPAS